MLSGKLSEALEYDTANRSSPCVWLVNLLMMRRWTARTETYYGYLSQRWEVSGILLTEVSYPSGHWIPSHMHEHPFFSFCLEGEAGTFRNTQEERQSKLLYHPPGEIHERHRRAGFGKSFYVELGPVLQERMEE